MDRTNRLRMLFWFAIFWIFLFIALYQGYFVYFPDTLTTKSKWVGLFAGSIAVLAASCKVYELLSYRKDDDGINEEITTINKYAAYFHKIKFVIQSVLFIILTVIFSKLLGLQFSISFLFGSVICILSDKISSYIGCVCTGKTYKTIDNTQNTICKLSFDAGSIVSFSNIGLIICTTVILYHIFKDYQTINGLILGYATFSLINGIGHIISLKSSTVANNTVLDLEPDLNENANPVFELKNITGRISKFSLINTDLGLCFIATLIASMSVGGETLNLQGAFFPIVIATNGIFASVIATLLTRFKRIKVLKKVYFAHLLAVCIFCIICAYCTKLWFSEFNYILYPILLGAIFSYILNFLNLKYSFSKFKPVKNIINSAIRGLFPVFEQGLKEGFISSLMPVMLIAIFLLSSFMLTNGISTPLLGLWGMCLGILAITSLSCMYISTNSLVCYINKNDSSNKCTTISHIVECLSQNFSNTSSILTVVSLILAYSVIVPIEEIDILNPFVTFSILIGIILPFLFNSFVISAISKNAKYLILEAKKQLKNFPQIKRNEMLPEYTPCIELSAKKSMVRVIVSLIIISIIITTIGLTLGTEALSGLMFGSIFSTLYLIFSISGSYSAIKTAKKQFEDEFYNPENSEEFRQIDNTENIISNIQETIVPSFNLIIKYIAAFALALVPIFL